MMQAHDHIVPASEKARINRLEMLDEVEEWVLLMSHYCLTVGVKGEMLKAVVELLPGDSTATATVTG
jgi:hypothetical protein